MLSDEIIEAMNTATIIRLMEKGSDCNDKSVDKRRTKPIIVLAVVEMLNILDNREHMQYIGKK